jgi:tRNA(Ile)-lysidine synthase
LEGLLLMISSFAQAMAHFTPTLPLAVAYSGGADSTALLLACAEKWPGQVSAIHIHHGLQAAADDFEQHCRAFCAQLGVPLLVKAVNAHPAPGQSPEDAARRARYEAFRAVAQAGLAQAAIKNIAIAQHADDQVETLLLALSRGAGLAGLSAMPAHWQRDGIDYHRPLLQVPGVELRRWLQERGVAFVTDPTNANEHYTRNRIRARLLPVLEAAFPAFRETFARSASHAAQAQEVLTDVAIQDLTLISQPPILGQLQTLSRARQANVLRHWLKTTFQTVPSTAQLEELLDQVSACTTRGHQIHIKVGSGFLQRKGQLLDWYNP